MNILRNGWRVIVAVSLAAMLWNPPTVFAQASGDEPAKNESDDKSKPKAAANQADQPKDKPAADKAPKADRPTDAAADKVDKKPKQADDDANDEGDTPNGKAKNPKTAKKKMVKEEAKYRDQMARIDRLRELAKEQNNTERLASLDKLETKLTNLHDRKMNKQRKRLSDEDAKAVDKHLENGKAQGLIHGKGPDGQGPPGLLKKEEDAGANDKSKGNDKDKSPKDEKDPKKDTGVATTPQTEKDKDKGPKKEPEADGQSKGGKPDAGSQGGGSDKDNKGGSKKP